MLQRAASNAYSWWWASHIRTKQSKWLEQNLKDMEEKVEIVLKMIEEDGDSFAKRAEMYYKKRPELISFVEESYRAYRALAERYDHISNELQNANNTIASVFPEKVQFSIDEEDEDASAKIPKKPSKPAPGTKVPEAPKGPEPAPKKLLPSASTKAKAGSNVLKSGLEKPEALEEIDRLQKRILALQTEKEFVKSSYENRLGKYWEIEAEIKAMQERVSTLQDEFGEGMLIEDAEARSLMAETAIRSCHDTLAHLHRKLHRSADKAQLESRRITQAKARFDSLRAELLGCSSPAPDEPRPEPDPEPDKASLEAKIREQFEVRAGAAFTVTDMVEKVDELVNKVMGLETAVSSQAALVERLEAETDELQVQIRGLEAEKASLTDGKAGLGERLRETEEKLKDVQLLNRSFEEQSNNLQIHFTEANCNLDHLSGKLQSVSPDEDEPEAFLPVEPGSTGVRKTNPFEDATVLTTSYIVENNDDERIPENPIGDPKETASVVSTSEGEQPETDQTEPNLSDEPDWKKLFADGMDDREKTLLKEYTATLRSYKDAKKKLSEAEKRNQDGLIRELTGANAKKDEEIRALRLKLGLLEDTLGSTEAEAALSRLPEASPTMSATEEKFRTKIDELLEQNLEFWLRFSASFHQIQEFDTEVSDLKSEIKKLEQKRRESNAAAGDTLQSLLRSDARPLYTHMREIQAKLVVWLEKSALLRDELECRFSSLCEIQGEITKALKSSAEEEDEFFKFTSHQAAKFQGEVLNMKQENNKVAEELRAGLDHVAAMQAEVERTLARLDEDFGLAGAKKPPPPAAAEARARIPLRSFIFGVKNKKQKHSIFSCVAPAMQRKYHGFRTTTNSNTTANSE